MSQRDYLQHYGTPRHSGRYPWGSGANPYQRNKDFVGNYKKLRKQGLTNAEIAKGWNMTTKELISRHSIAVDAIRRSEQAQAQKLKDKGYSYVAIGKRMGKNESSIRALLDPELQRRRLITTNTANALKDAVRESKYIDVGAEVNRYMGISSTKLDTALQALKDEGYNIYNLDVLQQGTGKHTKMKILCDADVTRKEVYQNLDKLTVLNCHTENGGDDFFKAEPPRSISSKRVQICYAEEGGLAKDGLIELRRGCEDLNLGNAHYAQVRIAVDGTHYMKGMAVYRDDMPPGIDVIYNTNKKIGTPALGDADHSVMKLMKTGKDHETNPFGATIKDDKDLVLIQRHYEDKDGKTQLSALNIVNEEGNWGDWDKTLSSQMLSKQSPRLAKRQLDLAYKVREEEYAEIMSLTNPAVKAKLLKSFSDSCDADAVTLKAAGMPRQGSHVLLPFPELSENECYAPDFRDGEKVVLIRYPFAGNFEAAELTVNNNGRNTKNAARVMGRASKDAIGINAKVAEKMSGADFDGDTALVIPNNSGELKVLDTLKELDGFDPKMYKLPDSAPRITNKTKQNEMGRVSNLITDMTIQGAPLDEIARAVKHSMVVIDAEKHHLDYKQSYEDNNIAELKQRYQLRTLPDGRQSTGAATLISRASSKYSVPERKEGQFIIDPKTGKERLAYYDPITGEKLYRETKRTYTDKKGRVHTAMQDSTKMAEAKDAYELSSGTYMENIYADYANKQKALANKARLSLLDITPTPYNASAREAYSKEVASIEAQYDKARRNAPLERKAQALSNTIANARIADNPNITKDEEKKIRNIALKEARHRVGAGKTQVTFSEREWEAVNAGAFRHTKLVDILKEADEKQLKQLSMPKKSKGMSASKVSLARQMLNNRGYTLAEVADQLGVSTSTLELNLKGKA